MKINIYHLIEGARKARGLTVVIDVFRAFSLEAYLLDSGAERIYPVGDVDLAYRLKAEDPALILAGERGGKILSGFDTGNSPSQLHGLNTRDRRIVHTTSAGTQGIANAKDAALILGGSLVNAKATAEYIRTAGYDEVSLVCMGLAGVTPTEEDTLCAEYIKSLIEDRPIPLREAIEDLKRTSGAKFFDPAQKEVFPGDDFFLCTDVDRFDFVLRLVRPEAGLPYMVKESVI